MESYMPSRFILILRSAMRRVSKDARSCCKRGLLLLALCLSTTTASALDLDGKLVQGGLVLGTAVPGATATLDGRSVPVAPDGRFVFGFGRDATQAMLVVTLPDGTRDERHLAIEKREYDIQRVDGVPQNTVTPDPAELARIRREATEIRALRDVAGTGSDFVTPMIWPVH